MKTLFSISMSLLFFFQGISIDMDFCGPIKEISSILIHYQDHKVYGDSFLEYVVEDYFGNVAKAERHHNDSGKQKTPIHSHQQCCHPLVLIIANNNSALINLLKFEGKEQFNLYKVNFTSRYLESLFQPPKV
ncbi:MULTISPECIES: hypothetical protein [Flavobacteriaceae]|jgi:hypothetical protein|uniref:Uncharacterized protein n=7 Tax=Flavobacteriaceae TaxID=49546 RepID=A0ABU7IT54_9FLAO|nr:MULTISPECIES: hypothetical protein [Flavobacteriaceae]MDC6388777.1 hypothetical protein [Maribacter sp. PR1]MEE1976165.1 hypothetical protein [Maribacter cobaltidurans]UBZ14373.1 hypothetical protein LDL77_01350 [Allomuricauda aquimarina]|tara:strand:+ start:193 stop:588 length:396 start_codon:yes stop_codon:yes gene_type:complete